MELISMVQLALQALLPCGTFLLPALLEYMTDGTSTV
jgi:hypothetical protein